MQISTNNVDTLLSAWWNTSYLPMIENGNELVRRLHPTETTSLYNTISTFINTLDEAVISYYHISYQVSSPDDEFHGSSHIYIVTTTKLYYMISSISITADKATITPSTFKKVISYSSLPSSTQDIISTHSPLTSFLQPLQIENGFEHIYQKISDFKELFNTETQMQTLPPQ